MTDDKMIQLAESSRCQQSMRWCFTERQMMSEDLP